MSKSRQYDVDADRRWKCPHCGHTERRHWNEKERPFCEPCEWQHGTLIEMEPKGKDTEKYD